MRALIASVLILCVSVSSLQADQTTDLLQRLINKQGYRCDGIANIRPGARIDNGDVMVVVDCVGGGSHVVRVTPDKSISYYMECGKFLNPIKC